MRHGRPRQGGRSVAIATGIGRGPDPKNRVGSLTLGDEIIVLAAVERVELAAAHSGRPRLRPLATIHATIMLESAAPSAAASDSFCSLVRGHTALCICAVRAARCAATANGTNGTFRSIKILRHGTKQGPSDCRVKDRGKKTASLPIYRRIQTGKRRRSKAADKTPSCRK